jgi:8-oxo-dGTP pyrophosphatase MutT (NUDIX family)
MRIGPELTSVPDVVSKLAKLLPRDLQDRIDYTNSIDCPVIVCFIVAENQVLLLKRSQEVSAYRGYWNTLAGYLDEEKPLIDVILEELDEELQLDFSLVEEIKSGEIYHNYDPDSGKNWIVHPSLVRLIQMPEIVIDWEHTDYKWVMPEDMDLYNTPPKLSTAFIKLFY